MKYSIQRLVNYLEHIGTAIDRIARYTEHMEKAPFLENTMVQDAVIRNLEIIGEASHNIETQFSDFAAGHPELQLAFAYQMRNAVAHGYFKVDFEIVWKTLHNDLPALRQRIRRAINELSPGAGDEAEPDSPS